MALKNVLGPILTEQYIYIGYGGAGKEEMVINSDLWYFRAPVMRIGIGIFHSLLSLQNKFA
jgi:hypothetical protein